MSGRGKKIKFLSKAAFIIYNKCSAIKKKGGALLKMTDPLFTHTKIMMMMMIILLSKSVITYSSCTFNNLFINK